MTTVSTERLAAVLAEVAGTLIDEFNLIEFLQLLTDRVAGLHDTAAAGLFLADRSGDLHLMAASGGNADLLDLLSRRQRDGPCLDAFHATEPVAGTDLRLAGSRRPRLAPRAVADVAAIGLLLHPVVSQASDPRPVCPDVHRVLLQLTAGTSPTSRDQQLDLPPGLRGSSHTSS